MIGMLDPTGKGVVVNCAASPFKPCKQTCPDVGRDLELYGTTCLLLDDHGAGSNFLTHNEGSDFDLNKIAASKLTVDCEIKQRAISHPPLSVEEEADRPNLALLQGLLDADFSAGVPSRSAQCGRIVLCATIGRQENA